MGQSIYLNRILLYNIGTYYVEKRREMKRAVLFTILLAMLLAALTACSGLKFEDIVINAEDVVDAPVGEYTLMYSIDRYEKYNEKFNLALTVTVYDSASNRIEVKNNRTITVELDEVYTISVVCSAAIDGEVKSTRKIFTVTAKKSPPSVNFYVGGNLWKYFGPEDLDETNSLNISKVPEVPRYFDSPMPGYDREITEKKWTVLVGDKSVELNQDHLMYLTGPLSVYAEYRYSLTPKIYTIEFENYGGTPTETIEATVNTNLRCPEYPTKENHIFVGWYSDTDFTKPFNWNHNIQIRESYKLYARWIEVSPVETVDLFDYVLKTGALDGYPYYELVPKNKSLIVGDIILPNGYGNIPVRGIQAGAFARCEGLTSVTIPAHYDGGTQEAFRNCTNLREVTFEAGSRLTIIDRYAFLGCSALEEIILPDGITKINTAAFQNCTSLRNVKLPSKLADIDTYVFDGCANLTSIAIPDAITNLPTRVFGGCENLATVTISKTSALTSIAPKAFENCSSLRSITLPYYFYKNNIKPFGDDVTVSYHPEVKEDEE